MTPSEKNLKKWAKVFDAKPSTAALMTARAQEVRPEFCGMNKWICSSTTREGVVYHQEVYFAGYCETRIVMNEITPEFSHGFLLTIDCSCPAGREGIACKHQAAIQWRYEADYNYLFALFNLGEHATIKAMYEKAFEACRSKLAA
jgi:hypothetical protein